MQGTPVREKRASHDWPRFRPGIVYRRTGIEGGTTWSDPKERACQRKTTRKRRRLPWFRAAVCPTRGHRSGCGSLSGRLTVHATLLQVLPFRPPITDNISDSSYFVLHRVTYTGRLTGMWIRFWGWQRVSPHFGRSSGPNRKERCRRLQLSIFVLNTNVTHTVPTLHQRLM
jgi:hypothetical protein